MPNGKKKSYPVLERLSTEELEKLLAQDFAAPCSVEPDVDFILEVMEVIQSRKDEEASGSVDVDTAWEEFQAEYQGRADAFKLDKQPKPRTPKKLHGLLRYAGVAAALILLLSGIASAMGFDVFQAIASWTPGTFSFVSGYQGESVEHPQDAPGYDVFGKLRSLAEDVTDVPFVPTWAPDVLEESAPVTKLEESNFTTIVGSFQMREKSFFVGADIYNEIPEEYTAVYQKDDNPVTEYEVNGITHYIFTNNKMRVATWTYNNIEAYITGVLTQEEMEKIIDSICEE